MTIDSRLSQEIQYSSEDLKTFRSVTLVFFASILFSFLISFAGNAALSSLVSSFGFAVLAVGIFTFSNKYPNANSGKQVSLLIAVLIVINIISIIVNSLTPLPDIDEATSQTELIRQMESIVELINVTVLVMIILGVFVLIIAYMITKWFNSILPKMIPKTNAYLYYGITALIGQIAMGFGLLSLGNAFRTILNRQSVSAFDFGPLISGLLLTGVGALIVLVGAVIHFVAAYKIYSRVNILYQSSLTMGSVASTPQYGQEPSYPQKLPSSTQYGQDPSYPQKESNQLEPKVKFCSNCGTDLNLEIKFCGKCGIKTR